MMQSACASISRSPSWRPAGRRATQDSTDTCSGPSYSFEQRAPIRLPAFDYSESASTHSTSGAPGVSNPASSTTVGSLPWL